ncbi:MAG: Ig-like domain-containing protein [Tannerellaceae bacterium]|jgi:uncharacterized protein YjdB|nr:Ig-like domain-containing protein [Tannerellaceae bacterium]
MKATVKILLLTLIASTARAQINMPYANDFASQTSCALITDLKGHISPEIWPPDDIPATWPDNKMIPTTKSWAYVTSRMCILFIGLDRGWSLPVTEKHSAWMYVLFSLEPVNITAIQIGLKKIKDYKWTIAAGMYRSSAAYPSIDIRPEQLFIGQDILPQQVFTNLQNYYFSYTMNAPNHLIHYVRKTLFKTLSDPGSAILGASPESSGSPEWGDVTESFEWWNPYTLFSTQRSVNTTEVKDLNQNIYIFRITGFLQPPTEARTLFQQNGSYENHPISEYLFNIPDYSPPFYLPNAFGYVNDFVAQTDYFYTNLKGEGDFTNRTLQEHLFGARFDIVNNEPSIFGMEDRGDVIAWVYVSPRFLIFHVNADYCWDENYCFTYIMFSLEPVNIQQIKDNQKKICDFNWVLAGGMFHKSTFVSDITFNPGDFFLDRSPREAFNALRSWYKSNPHPNPNDLRASLRKALVLTLSDPLSAILYGTDWGNVNDEIYGTNEIDNTVIHSYPEAENECNATLQINFFSKNGAAGQARRDLRESGYYNGKFINDYRLAGPLSLIISPDLAEGKTYTPVHMKYPYLQLSPVLLYANQSINFTNPLWTSSNPEIISVDANGLLTAHSTGEAIITLEIQTTYSTIPMTAKRRIVVLPAPVPTLLPALEQGQDFTQLPLDKTLTLSPYALYDGDPYTFTNVSWQSSDPTILTVDNKGFLIPHAEGSATISFHADGDYGYTSFALSRMILVTVANQSSSLSSISPVPSNGETFIRLSILETLQFSVTNPHIFTSTGWTSSNPNIAFIDNTGLLKTLAPGTVTIIFNGSGPLGGVTLTRDVTVLPYPQILPLLPKDQTIFYLQPSQQITFSAKATFNGNPYPMTDFSWISSNNTVATVNDNGQVTALVAGEATITLNITGAHGSFIATRKIIVYPALKITTPHTDGVTTVHLDRPPVQFQIEAIYGSLPVSLSDVTWTSSNPEIAGVNNEGIVTVYRPGSATINVAATTPVGRFSAMRQITVPNGLSLHLLPALPNGHSATQLAIGKTVTFSPEGYYNGTLYILSGRTWKSSAPDIVSVNSGGMATALSPGQAIITLTASGSLGLVTLSRTVYVPPVLAVQPALEAGTTATFLSQGQSLHLSPQSVSYNFEPYPLYYHLSSSAPDIVEVNQEGKLVALDAGDAIISLQAAGKMGSTSLTRNVVVPPSPQILPPLLPGEFTTILPFGEKDTFTVEASYNRQPYTFSAFKWTSSNTNIVGIDKKGVVTPLNLGQAVITFQSTGDFTASLTRQVLVPPYLQILPLLSAGREVTFLPKGQEVRFSTKEITFNGAPYEFRNYKWTSSAPNIVNVDNNGRLTAIESGEAVITLQADGDWESASDSRRVSVPPVPIILPALEDGQTAGVLSLNETLTLSVKAFYNGVDYPFTSIKWTSNNLSVVSVDEQTGLLTPHVAGNATITVTATTPSGSGFGRFVVTRDITIVDPPEPPVDPPEPPVDPPEPPVDPPEPPVDSPEPPVDSPEPPVDPPEPPVDPPEPPVLQILPTLDAGKAASVLQVSRAFLLTVQATYNNADYPLKNPTWISSNPTVTSVTGIDGGGLLITRQLGEAVISFQAYGTLGLIGGTRNITVVDDSVTPPETPSLAKPGSSQSNTPILPNDLSARSLTYYTLTGHLLGSTPPVQRGVYLCKNGEVVTKFLVR